MQSFAPPECNVKLLTSSILFNAYAGIVVSNDIVVSVMRSVVLLFLYVICSGKRFFFPLNLNVNITLEHVVK